MPSIRILERSSIEAYAAIALAAILAVTTLTWWFQTILLLVVGALAIDVAFHASWMIRRSTKWKIALCLVLLVSLGALGIPTIVDHYNDQPSQEDLRVSFDYRWTDPNNLNVTYLFRNVSAQSALITGVALFEIVSYESATEPERNVERCDQITQATLQALQVAPIMMGEGAQVGNPSLENSIYSVRDLTVDGLGWDPRVQIPIDGTRTRIVSADFGILPNHRKLGDTLILCPIVTTLDIKNVAGTAICKGVSVIVSARGSTATSNRQQFRVLPHSSNSFCPVTPN